MRLHSSVSGSGPVVIILHGLFGSSGNWRSVAQRLATSFEVHALDLRNHGASPWYTDMSYPAMAEDVREYMRFRGINAACVVGHSMGGKVAIELALATPQPVSGLLVLDIAPSAYERAHDRILEGMMAVEIRSVGSREEVDRRLAVFVPDARERHFLLTNLRRREDGGYAWRLNLESIASTYDGLLAEVARGRRSTLPALFMRGERSHHIGPAEVRAIMQAFPNARIDTVPEAGHWLGADAPDAVVEGVRRIAGTG
jgi:esterase